MRVLVVGPGVIGSVVAARLALAGHEVTVFGRGQRLRTVRERGLRLWNQARGSAERASVAVTERLEDRDDTWVVVAVRAHQLEALWPRLEATRGDVFTLVNHAGRLDPWRRVLGERLVPGFPGISGAFEDDVVHYRVAPAWLQPTTLGEVEGASPRVEAWAAHLTEAGLPTRVESRMEAWLRCHAGWMAALMVGTLACEGDPRVLIDDGALRRDVVGALRESFTALERDGVPLTPRGLEAFRRLPAPMLSGLLALSARRPELAGRIRDPAPILGEAAHVTSQLRVLFDQTGVATPSWNRLFARLDGLVGRA